MLGSLYRRFKQTLNWLADRVIEAANQVRLNERRPQWLRAAAFQLGSWAAFVRDFPRLNVYRLCGETRSVIFVGSERGQRELRQLLFPGDVEVTECGRVALWRLNAEAHNWLSNDVHLVVCEFSRVNPWRPHAPITFTMPVRVTQVLDISADLNTLLAGGNRKSLRQHVSRAEKAGFTAAFTQSENDLRVFYNRIYAPFIRARHGDRALLGSYDSQRDRWFRRGGLMQVKLGEEMLGGMLCFLSGDTVFCVEGGYAQDDPRLHSHGLTAFSDWHIIRWGKERGARFFDMGISSAWRISGPFMSKRRWGAVVRRSRLICPDWVFLAAELPPDLTEHLNRAGLISEIGGKFYSVHLCPADLPPNLAAEAKTARQEGLAGVVVIQPHTPPAVY